MRIHKNPNGIYGRSELFFIQWAYESVWECEENEIINEKERSFAMFYFFYFFNSSYFSSTVKQ